MCKSSLTSSVSFQKMELTSRSLEQHRACSPGTDTLFQLPRHQTRPLNKGGDTLCCCWSSLQTSDWEWSTPLSAPAWLHPRRHLGSGCVSWGRTLRNKRDRQEVEERTLAPGSQGFSLGPSPQRMCTQPARQRCYDVTFIQAPPCLWIWLSNSPHHWASPCLALWGRE